MSVLAVKGGRKVQSPVGNHCIRDAPSPAIRTACVRIVVLGRWRNRIIRRQRHIDQPAVADFRSELNRAGPPFSELPAVAQFKRAAAVRGAVMGAIGECGDEAQSLIGLWTEEASGAFKAKLAAVLSADGVELSPAELEAAAILVQDVAVDRDALAVFGAMRKNVERRMKLATRELPVHGWWVSVRGCDELGLATIVAEAGDLSNYGGVCKLRKRMGLAPFKGKSCATWKSKGGLSGEEWTEAGYVPRRRSVMWNVGTAIVRAGGEYKDIYLKRKAVEYRKAVAAGKTVTCMSEATRAAWMEAGMGSPVVSKVAGPDAMSVKWLHNRAQRYMEQCLLRDLWLKWNGKQVAVPGPASRR